jgi:hypothetical protein
MLPRAILGATTGGSLAHSLAIDGILDLAHQSDDYVEIDALVASAKVMALTVLRLRGAL